MIDGIPRISVYIITYNQEAVIHRTLASVLSQLDYVYEICVSDDHSTDKTWDILNEYSKKNPGLFKLNRNEKNLGIFENTEKVWAMPTGDIVHDLAGDDCVGEGWFKKVIEYIDEKQIDYRNELFCIYGDYQCVYPNGDSIVMHNDAIGKTNGKHALKMALRGIINSRSSCYSINILRKYKNVSRGRSHIAEDAQDRQLQVFSEKNYYIPSVGNIYYARMGISTQIDENTFKERMEIGNYAMSFFNKWGVKIDDSDRRYYMEFIPAYQKLRFRFEYLAFVKLISLYFATRDWKLQNFKSDLRKLMFGIRRRLPHARTITMN